MKDHKRSLINTRFIAAISTLIFSFPITSNAESFSEMVNVQRIRANIDMAIPGADDNWDGGLGFRGQLIINPERMPEHYMLGLSIAISSWDAEDESVVLSNSEAASGQLSGDMSLVGLGISLLRSKELAGNAMMNFETGFIYQLVSSDTDLTYTYSDASTSTDEIDFDNNFLLNIGADISKPINDQTMVFLGAAYHFDLAPGDATAFNDEVENVTGNFKIQLGVEAKF